MLKIGTKEFDLVFSNILKKTPTMRIKVYQREGKKR